MPTYEWLRAFSVDIDRLSATERAAFGRAVEQFVTDLRRGSGFRKGLRVKRVQGWSDIWEMTWAPDGRATWQYGPAQREGEIHVIWRRIGGHEIFKNP